VPDDLKGALAVTTLSGSVYAFTQGFTHVRRLPGRREDVSDLRRDGEWIEVVSVETCRIGQPMRLVLTGLAEGYSTLRITTPVVDIQSVS